VCVCVRACACVRACVRVRACMRVLVAGGLRAGFPSNACQWCFRMYMDIKLQGLTQAALHVSGAGMKERAADLKTVTEKRLHLQLLSAQTVVTDMSKARALADISKARALENLTKRE
jgi:hypothetical protein